MHFALRSRAAVVVALACALLVSVACTSGDEAPPSDNSEAALERLLASSEATRESGTARMSQTMTLQFPEQGPDGEAPEVAGGSVTVEATGLLDFLNRRGRLSLVTEGTGMVGADALGGDMEMILDGEAMYMKSPFYQQLAPNHEPWLRISLEELGLRGLSQVGQQDPLAVVEILRGAYGEVEELGSEEVRGTSTTHLRANVDIGRLIEGLPKGSGNQVVASYKQLGIEEMPVDVWLDDTGRLRRLTSDVELTGRATQGGRMQLLVEFYDFGVAFDLSVPPAEQVADFADVFGEVEKG